MKASNYLPLLKELKAKRQCLNIQNNDEKYFLWSSLALLYPVQCRNHSDGVSNYQEHKRELNMSRIKYPIDIKILANSNTKTTLVLMDAKIKKSSRYVLPTWPLQDITWIYYISLLRKNPITNWWKTWADYHGDTLIMATTKNNSANIVYMAAPVKRYWKTIWKDASYKEHKESSSQKLTTKRGITRSNLQKQNTNYVYLLSSMQVLFCFMWLLWSDVFCICGIIKYSIVNKCIK